MSRTIAPIVVLFPLFLAACQCSPDGELVDVEATPTPEPITEEVTEEPTEAVTEAPEPDGLPSAALLAAIAAIDDEQRAATLPAEIDRERGGQDYETTCTFCHGASGKGDGAAAEALDPRPGDWTDDERFGLTTDGEKAWLVLEGVGEGSAMPGYKVALSENQVWQLVAYLGKLNEVKGEVEGEGEGEGEGEVEVEGGRGRGEGRGRGRGRRKWKGRGPGANRRPCGTRACSGWRCRSGAGGTTG